MGGQAGSGKSTTGKVLARKLGFAFYSMGNLRRKMALERGMTLHEFNKLGEREAFTDKKVDDYQKKIGQTEDNFVIDGRLSFYFIPNSVKIFLKADLKTRAQRVFNNEREFEKYKTLKDAMSELKKREESDKVRYKKYYRIDCYDERYYDLVVDTSDTQIGEVVEKILVSLKGRKLL